MGKKGFTLIEIIIVIVILGVLATLALPRLSGQMNSAEGAEAMQAFGMIKRAAMDCYDNTNTFASCDTQAALTISVPSPGRFNYAKSSGAATLIITARQTRNTANAVSMRVSNDGTVNFHAGSAVTNQTGPFVGIVNKTSQSDTSITPAASVSVF